MPGIALKFLEQAALRLLDGLPEDPETSLWLMAALSLFAQRYVYFVGAKAHADALVDKLCRRMAALLSQPALGGATVLDPVAGGVRFAQAIVIMWCRRGVSAPSPLPDS